MREKNKIVKIQKVETVYTDINIKHCLKNLIWISSTLFLSKQVKLLPYKQKSMLKG